jgi:outer membrane protein assembly factor BamB
VISANHTNSYTLYVVGKNGTLRWAYESPGLRKGLAITVEHVLHLLSQSADGTVASVAGFDEASGAKAYELHLPDSYETLAELRKSGADFVCAAASVSSALPINVTGLFVNMDGNAYVGFSRRVATLRTAACTPGSDVNAREIRVTRAETLMLWQIHPDGTYRTTVIETFSGDQPLSSPVATSSPTHEIIPDNMYGILMSVRVAHRPNWGGIAGTAEEFVYRLDPAGDLIYRFPLPQYAGPLRDEMVIGENDVAFATRGGSLIAFDIGTGKPLWTWDSRTPEISVVMALANGGCAVQTPTALVEVENATTSKELMKGKVLMDWLGNMYTTHN